MRKQLIGAWKLVSIEMLVDGNVVYPYGDHPLGLLIYHEVGRITAQIMRPGRYSSLTDPDAIPLATASELRQIAEGYLGYFGTFTIDEENNTVTHHVEACTLPAWVGTDQQRQYEFDGSRLSLSSGPNRLVWERIASTDAQVA